MKRLLGILMGVVLVVSALGARAELTIEISQGSDNPTTIAVVPFAWQGAGAAPEDLASVVDGDLARSGQFAPIARTDMLGTPSTEAEVFYRDWRSLNTEYLLIGRVSMRRASCASITNSSMCCARPRFCPVMKPGRPVTPACWPIASRMRSMKN